MRTDPQTTKQPIEETEQVLLKRRAELHQFLQECGECQKEVEPSWQFCAHCGTRLSVTCPACGTPLPPAGAHSCPRCGLEIPQINITLEA